MTPWDIYWFSAFVLVFLAWASLSAFVILSRLLYNMRRRSVRAVKLKLDEATLREAFNTGDRQKIESTVAVLPRRTIEQIAADSSTPSWLAEAFAAYVLERWGAQHLVRASAAHRGERQKWSRVAALRILTLSGYPDAIRWLGEALGSRDAEVVGAAVILLGRTPGAEAARLLVGALRGRVYPASRIATQLDRFTLSIPHLLRPLGHDPVPEVRFWCATLLARYAGAEDVNQELAELSRDPDANVRTAAVESLGSAGGPYAAQSAVDLIADPVWYVRAHAARALGTLRRVDLCEIVAPLLSDREWWVRIATREALQAMGQEVEPTLILCLDSPDTFARNGAAEVLQNLGVLDRLIAEVDHSQEVDQERIRLIRKIIAAGGRGLAAAALARAGPDVGSDLVRLLDGPDHDWPRSA